MLCMQQHLHQHLSTHPSRLTCTVPVSMASLMRMAWFTFCVNTQPCSASLLLLQWSMACCTSSTLMMGSTGPKGSSQAMRMLGVTLSMSVGHRRLPSLEAGKREVCQGSCQAWGEAFALLPAWLCARVLRFCAAAVMPTSRTCAVVCVSCDGTAVHSAMCPHLLAS